MDKHVKLILNSLKCPLCRAQIDMYDYMGKGSKSASFNFCCAADYYHYRLWYPYWDHNSKIEYDMVRLYEGKYLYMLDQRYKINRTRIDVKEVDAEHNIIDEFSSSHFVYHDQILFDYPNTNRTKIVNRLKTILTFQ